MKLSKSLSLLILPLLTLISCNDNSSALNSESSSIEPSSSDLSESSSDVSSEEGPSIDTSKPYYQKVSSYLDDYSGTYLLSNTLGSNALILNTSIELSTKPNILDLNEGDLDATKTIITGDYKQYEVNIEKEADGYTFKLSDGMYLSPVYSKNSITQVANKVKHTINFINNEIEVSVKIEDEVRYLRYNGDSKTIRYYKSSTTNSISNIELFKLNK